MHRPSLLGIKTFVFIYLSLPSLVYSTLSLAILFSTCSSPMSLSPNMRILLCFLVYVNNLGEYCFQNTGPDLDSHSFCVLVHCCLRFCISSFLFTHLPCTVPMLFPYSSLFSFLLVVPQAAGLDATQDPALKGFGHSPEECAKVLPAHR